MVGTRRRMVYIERSTEPWSKQSLQIPPIVLNSLRPMRLASGFSMGLARLIP
jgi:hypothetical protein